MDILAIIAKAAAGTALTAEERAALAEAQLYTQAQLDTEANARATSSRKQAERKTADAEAERDRLKTENAELREKTDDTRWAKEKARLEEENATLKKQADEMKTASAKAARKAKIAELAGKVGFVEKDSSGNVLLSEQARAVLVEAAFAEVDAADMDRPAVVDPVLKKLREENPHLIAASGNGSGRKPEDVVNIPGVYRGANPWAKATFNLSQQGIIQRANPQLADQLKQQAAAT